MAAKKIRTNAHESPAGVRTMEEVYGYKPTLLPGERDCPTCRPTGINPVAAHLVCPKCNGERKVGADA